MAQPAPIYDLMLLLDTAADEAQHAKVLADVDRIIRSGGEVIGEHDWGVRALAYEIEHKDDAHYRLVQFHANAEILKELDRTLSIADGLVRYRIVKLDPGTPPPPDASRPPVDEPAPAPAPAG